MAVMAQIANLHVYIHNNTHKEEYQIPIALPKKHT